MYFLFAFCFHHCSLVPLVYNLTKQILSIILIGFISYYDNWFFFLSLCLVDFKYNHTNEDSLEKKTNTFNRKISIKDLIIEKKR
jgi:hypothetical protein